MNKRKYLLLVFKLLVFSACLYYLFRCALQLDISQLKPIFLVSVFLSGCLYFICTFFLARAWHLIILFLHQSPIPFKEVSAVYFTSALAKYLPSNMMHYTVRHYMCRRFDLSQKNIFLSNLLEIILILMAAVILIGTFFLLDIAQIPKQIAQNRPLINKLLCLLAGGSFFTLSIVAWKKTKTIQSNQLKSLLKLTTVFCLYILFLLSTGLVFFILLWTMNIGIELSAKNITQVVFCYACSWTLGFITPGSPGGLGVRESIMVMILTPLTGTDIALISAILFRLTTLQGELFGYLYAKIIQKIINGQSPPPSHRS